MVLLPEKGGSETRRLTVYLQLISNHFESILNTLIFTFFDMLPVGGAEAGVKELHSWEGETEVFVREGEDILRRVWVEASPIAEIGADESVTAFEVSGAEVVDRQRPTESPAQSKSIRLELLWPANAEG